MATVNVEDVKVVWAKEMEEQLQVGDLPKSVLGKQCDQMLE